uniref:Aldehyde dehydrogenase n=1 Tax=Mustela putorius furo TaxID=9669 RepID=M3XLV8_MUSPF
MSKISEVVQRARAAFNLGKTRPLQFRIQQLEALRCMIKEHEKDIVGALTADLHKDTVNFRSAYSLSPQPNVGPPSPPPSPREHPSLASQRAPPSLSIHPSPEFLVLKQKLHNFCFALSQPKVASSPPTPGGSLEPSSPSPSAAEGLLDFVLSLAVFFLDLFLQGGLLRAPSWVQGSFQPKSIPGAPPLGSPHLHIPAQIKGPSWVHHPGGKSSAWLGPPCLLWPQHPTWGAPRSQIQGTVCQDHTISTPSISSQEIEYMIKKLPEWAADEPVKSRDYGRIINSRHFQRVMGLMEGQKVAYGGTGDAATRYIASAPTILIDVDPKSPVMQEEIFGPVMPIMCVRSLEEAIQFINQREKPLALYVFSLNDKVVKKVIAETSSGGVTANDVIVHISVHSLPYGGVGNSGMGSYHGKKSFETFSHRRSCLVRPLLNDESLKARYPPSMAKMTRH